MHDFKFYGSATIGTKGQVVIPAEAREELGIREGDKVAIMKAPHGGGVIVLKAEKIAEMMDMMHTHLDAVTKSMKNTTTNQ